MRLIRYRVRPDVAQILSQREDNVDRIRWGSVEPGGYGSQLSRLKVTEFESDPFLVSGLAPQPTGQKWDLGQVELLAPIVPSKVVAIGKNYVDHAAEMDSDVPSSPLMFLKPPSSVIGPGDEIVLPNVSERVDYEGELTVVIGKRCRNVAAADAGSVIAGYTCANDVTARDLQKSDGQWSRAKGFDTFCPIGPWVETGLELTGEHPEEVGVSTEVNDEIKQAGVTTQMVFSVAELVAYASSVMTLEPGDVILTGTPAGIGPLSDGDSVTVRIEGIGALTNPVTVE
ncbi:MAG: fumarylacetoacetate hydrolase family protein [Candidatus Nanopelagicales bacterium]